MAVSASCSLLVACAQENSELIGRPDVVRYDCVMRSEGSDTSGALQVLIVGLDAPSTEFKLSSGNEATRPPIGEGEMIYPNGSVTKGIDVIQGSDRYITFIHEGDYMGWIDPITDDAMFDGPWSGKCYRAK